MTIPKDVAALSIIHAETIANAYETTDHINDLFHNYIIEHIRDKINSAFAKMKKGRTSFIVAHRLSTIRNADLILVMMDGDIVEQGNHEELLEKNGFYANLYNSQFEDVVA